MEDTKSVTIIMTSYFLEEVLFRVIDRLIEVTDYPYKLIVGDNLSENSESIRKRLKEYVDEGKIHKTYFFHGNYRGMNVREIFSKEPKSDYTILTDCDAYILEKDDPCWLTTFINTMEKDKQVAGIAFSSINSPTIITSRGGHNTEHVKKVKKLKDSIFCVKDTNKKRSDGECHHNGHFYTLRTSILKGLPSFVDGNIFQKLKRKGYKSYRYDKTSVINLSTIVALDLSEKYDIDITTNKNYLNLRRRSKHHKGNLTEKNYTVYKKRRK